MSDSAKTDLARVTIVDIDMPFWSMVTFIFRWTLAAIPALFILGLLAGVVAAVIGAIGMGLSMR